MRTPIYTKSRQARIISLPNGQWECQTKGGEPTKALPTKAIPHHDGWNRTHRPTTKDEALRQLGNLGEIEQGGEI